MRDIRNCFTVAVLETTDIVPRRNARKPNIYVKVFRGADGDPAVFVPRRKTTLGKHFLKVRLDLQRQTNFSTEKKAKRARDQLAQNLAKLDFTVNPIGSSKYSIYVLDLEQKISGKRRVYVGQTSKAVEIRIQEHLSGPRASRKVRNGFLRRAVELEPQQKFFSKWDAEAEETALGRELIRRGFEVVGPQGLEKQ